MKDKIPVSVKGRVTTRPKRLYSKNGQEYLVINMKNDRNESFKVIHFSNDPCPCQENDTIRATGLLRQDWSYGLNGHSVMRNTIIAEDIGRLSRPKRRSYKQTFKDLGLSVTPPGRGGSEGVI